MAFYDRLKESRIRSGLTQEQLAEKLGIAKSTLSGYEGGNREPTVATIAKALEILDIDANYLYQDETKALTELVISLDDKEFLKKYHELDPHGKKMVDFTLNEEYERVARERFKIHENNVVAAAHERTDIDVTESMREHDDDIMNDDSEWK